MLDTPKSGGSSILSGLGLSVGGTGDGLELLVGEDTGCVSSPLELSLVGGVGDAEELALLSIVGGAAGMLISTTKWEMTVSYAYTT